ncbi:1275_t:CDS:10, partial [Ambispora gerdemannii]
NLEYITGEHENKKHRVKAKRYLYEFKSLEPDLFSILEFGFNPVLNSNFNESNPKPSSVNSFWLSIYKRIELEKLRHTESTLCAINNETEAVRSISSVETEFLLNERDKMMRIRVLIKELTNETVVKLRRIGQRHSIRNCQEYAYGFCTPERQNALHDRYHTPKQQEEKEECSIYETQFVSNPFVAELSVNDDNFNDLHPKMKAMKENKTCPWRLSNANRKEIEVVFLSMKKKTCGRRGIISTWSCGAHSFVVDVDGELIKQHFSEAECLEMANAGVPVAPQLSQDIIDYLSKFNGKKTLKEIRKAINELMKDWISSTIKTLTTLDLRYTDTHCSCHVLAVIVDQGFADLEETSIVRGKSTSTANAERNKNAHRTTTTRRKSGHRGDWVLRRIGNGECDECGIGEAGKYWFDDHGTKFLKETVVQETANSGNHPCGDDDDDNPNGYVYRIRRGDLMQAVVRETIKTVQSKPAQSNAQASEVFVQAGIKKRPRNMYEIPSYMSTPKKIRDHSQTVPSNFLSMQFNDSED